MADPLSRQNNNLYFQALSFTELLFAQKIYLVPLHGFIKGNGKILIQKIAHL
jgi:hypothetical protein